MTACAVQTESDEGDALRAAEVEAIPAPDPAAPAIPAEEQPLAVTLVDGPTEPFERAQMIDALRAEGVQVLVTLPGGVWLTRPPSPQVPRTLEIAGHTLEILDELGQVEAAAEAATIEAEAAPNAAPEGDSEGEQPGDEAPEGPGEEPGAGGEEPVPAAGGAAEPAPIAFIEDRATFLDGLGPALSYPGIAVEPVPPVGEPDAPHALLPADLVNYEAGADPSDVDALPYAQGGPAAAAKAGPPARDVGKFLRGTVAIRVFFAESTGMGNETWTNAEYNDERNGIIAWLARLARVAPPTVGLVFDYDDLPPDDPVNAITEEPSNGVSERIWINQILDNIGVPGVGGAVWLRHFFRIQLLENDIRADTGADHAVVGFIARDEEEPLSEFNGLPWRDAWPHAFFNSYLVSKSDEGGITFIHELMHVFHAADEYDGGNFGTPCRDWSGLGHDRAKEAGAAKSNGNHENCNHYSDNQACLMDLDIAWQPFFRPLLCWHTRAQIGWHDSGALAVQAQYPASMGTPSPWPQVHIDGVHRFGREDFTYVQDGNTAYGSRRCATGSFTGSTVFSAEPGLTTSCNNDVNYSANVNGNDNDIEWPSGPTYLSGDTFDEGRVSLRVVDYQHFFCGDAICDSTETVASCPADCTCGNGTCEPSENFITCPADCTFCGNLVCEAGEDQFNCPSDCCVPDPMGGGCEV
ncbi:MAG: hypothetical protein K0V04_31945 [Deltaproteobacteria bacterium]|nr:hypothetical protein [Deltaproteobacteria bacterium]